ncbi:MAG TPA: DNA primase [Myxococcales bacterium]|nr:DNA primase [Deltaproteobacteria bacterium]MBU53875.1 DNA primase [Deltaproteobacteria bacterium]HAA58156.1 DNA primase [Myxococcales bacterium]
MAGTQDPVVQQIRDRVDIVELIQRYVPLKRAGSNYKACCPFHQEKTPSFNVNPERQFYYCFGCGAKGDVFSFLMNYEGKKFNEVIHQLADELGIEVRFSKARREEVTKLEQRKELLSQINQTAKLFFIRQLQTDAGRGAREYLSRRGVSEEMAEQFGLGYALDDWGALTSYLQGEGYSLEDAKEAGLIKQAESSDRHYDRLRHRITFPIHDKNGRIVGFGGRAMRSDDGAKYLNSPDSPLFHKSELLYGLHVAKGKIRRSKMAIFVEGYMDVIALHQFGFEEAIATLGTSLTSEHVKEIRRYAQRMVLLFDGDKAGFRAAARALGLLLPAGVSVDMLTLPDGEDPDSYLHKYGRESFEKLLEEETRPAFDSWLDYLYTQCDNDPIQIRAETDTVLELLHQLEDPLLRDLYLKVTAERFGLDESMLRRQFMRVVPDKRAAASEPTFFDEPPPPDDGFFFPEEGAGFEASLDFDPFAEPTGEPASVPQPFVESQGSISLVSETSKAPEDTCVDRAAMIALKVGIDHVETAELAEHLSDEGTRELFAESLWDDVWTRFLEDRREGAESQILADGVLDSLEAYPVLKEQLATLLLKTPPYEIEEAIKALEEIKATLGRLVIKKQIRQLTLAIREANHTGDEEQATQLVLEKLALQRQLPQLAEPPPVASS